MPLGHYFMEKEDEVYSIYGAAATCCHFFVKEARATWP